MKKLLLMTSLAFMMTAQANAQDKVTAPMGEKVSVKADFMNVGKAPIKMMNKVEQKAAPRGPRKLLADGLWFQRPEGSLWMRFNANASCFNVPPFTDLLYQNMSTDKASTTWAVTTRQGLVEQPGDEDNNFVQMLGGAGGFYAPTLQRGTASYNYGDDTESPIVLPYAYALDSLYELSHCNYNGGTYTGFTDGYIFGTYDRDITKEDGSTVHVYASAIHEMFEKPLRPLYVSSVFFYGISSVEDFLPEGVKMKLIITKTSDEHQGELIAEIPFTKDDVIQSWQSDGGDDWGSMFEISQKEVDAFGQEFAVPIIIDDAFMVTIEGFHQPGVNFSLFMTDVMAVPTDYYETAGKVVPTMRSYVLEDGTPLDDKMYYCQYIESTGENAQYARQYNAFMLFNAFYDVVELYDDCKTMTAPAEGGDLYFEAEEENDEGEMETVRYGTLQFYSTLPFYSTWEGLEGEENYFFEDVPEWISVGEVTDQYHADYSTILAQLTAEALPEGVEGRTASIRIVSDRGAEAVLTVVQGNVTEGIVTVKDGISKSLSKYAYNLGGQKVNSLYNGIMVKDGKKYFNK